MCPELQGEGCPFSDDDDAAKHYSPHTPPTITHTDNAYLPEDKEKDEDKRKGE